MEIIRRPNASVIFRSTDFLTSLFIPCSKKDLLQGVNLLSVNTAVHIMPFSYYFSAMYIVVSHIHATGVSYLAVYNHNLPVVTMKHMIYPRKAYRVKLI